MTMPTRAGRFRAQVLDRAVSETGPNHLATFMAKFHLLQELDPAEGWQDIAEESLQITGYFYIEKKDGALNDKLITSLRDTFKWDGRDPMWLEENPIPDCQVTLEFDSYEGKQRLRVQYVDAYESEGPMAIAKGTPAQKKALVNRLGPKLRALSGGTPANAGPPKADKPKRSKPPAGKPATATVDEAWGAIEAKGNEVKLDETAIASEWFRIIKAVANVDQPEMVTPEQWHVVLTSGPGMIVPF